MPLYEYECSVCSHRFEVIQKFSDDPLTVCGECGGTVSRLVCSPAIQFKGTGWYVTDYAGKGRTGAGTESNANKGEGEKAPSAAPQTQPGKESSGSAAEKAPTE